MTGLLSRLPQLLALLLAILMLASLAWQGWQFFQSEQSSEVTATARGATQSAETSTNQAPIDLPGIDLFGKPGAQATTELQSTENLPETNLRLYLRGVLAGDDETEASALIEGSDSKTEAYLIGDELPGNATLRSVYTNRVIIERSGKLENLYFPETSDSSGIDLEDTTPVASNQESAAATAPRATPPPGSAPGVTSDRREEIRRRLEELRERLRNNSN